MNPFDFARRRRHARLTTLVLGLLLIGCRPQEAAAPEASPAEAGPAGDEEVATPVQTEALPIAAVHPKSLKEAQAYTIEGHVIANRKSTVAARSEGVVRQVRILAGDRIGAGQPLMRLENPDQGIDLAALAHQRALNAGILANLATKARNYQDMLKLGLVARHDAQGVENDLRAKQVEQSALEQQMAHLRLRQGDNQIVARQGGYVQDVAAEGSYVTAGQTLVTVIAPQDQYIEVFVPFGRIDAIAPGTQASWSTGNIVHHARVVRITPESQSGLVRLLLQPDSLLPLDFRPNLTLGLKGLLGWQLPKTALVLVEGEPTFYLVKGGKAHAVKAKILRDLNGQIVVGNPLSPADTVAASKADMLHDEMSVQVQP